MDQLALAGQFGGHAGLAEALRVGLALVAQRVEAGGRRCSAGGEPGQVRREQRRDAAGRARSRRRRR